MVCPRSLNGRSLPLYANLPGIAGDKINCSYQLIFFTNQLGCQRMLLNLSHNQRSTMVCGTSEIIYPFYQKG